MSWVRDKLDKFILARALAKVVDFLKGKKTAIGAVSFLLWVTIYALPAFTPEYNWITHYATMLRDALKAGGVDLDNELFNAGAGFTIVGLLAKVNAWYKNYKNK